MELLQLKYFCAVAKRENITHAAKYYGIPQPAMSQTIARLEKELDTQLFERMGNRIYLNEKGKLFYKFASEALNAIENGKNALKDNENTLLGNIRLLVLENRNAMIELIAEFSSIHQHVNFRICHDFENIDSFDCDLCIASTSPRPDLKGKIPLLTEHYLLAVNKNHPLAQKKSVSFEDFANEKFVSMPTASSLYRIPALRFAEKGFAYKPVIICDDPYSVRQYVSLEMGVTFIPSIAWKGLVPENIVIIPITDSGFSRTTHVFWDEGKYMSETVRIFRDFLVEKFKNWQNET